MATAMLPGAASRARVPHQLRRRLWRILLAAVTIVGVAAVLRAAYDPWYINYDTRYSLLWSRDLWHGFKPDYTLPFAPTPHPLWIAVSSIAQPFGHLSDNLILALVLLCFGALAWLVYRLGAELFSPWAGAVAALVVASRPPLVKDAIFAYDDVAFAALIVAAVLLEVRRPRRGWPVLTLLALAGLLRPEAWVLAGLYWLWLLPGRTNRERAGLLALVVAAPLLWAFSDWVITGDPLHSLHGTSALAQRIHRPNTFGQLPGRLWSALVGTVLWPTMVALPFGLLLAWRHRRRAFVPLAAAAALLVVFAILPIFGLPLIGRYLVTPSVLLALFYGAVVLGWTRLPRGRERALWMCAGAAALACGILALPGQHLRLAELNGRLAAYNGIYGKLRDASLAAPTRAAFARCPGASAADQRPVPFMRWWLRGRPFSISSVEHHANPLGPMLFLPHGHLARRYYGHHVPHRRPPHRYRLVYANAGWHVYAAPRCVR